MQYQNGNLNQSPTHLFLPKIKNDDSISRVRKKMKNAVLELVFRKKNVKQNLYIFCLKYIKVLVLMSSMSLKISQKAKNVMHV